MASILCIETSTSVCSVAMVKDGIAIASHEEHVPNSHGSVVTLLIERLVASTGIVPGDFNAVAVSAGPGSYTGLRIGVSVAKGLCYALGIPLIAIPSLEVMAAGVEAAKLPAGVKLLCPMMDARRMEVYSALYDTQLNILQPAAPLVITQDSYSDLLSESKVAFFGNGSRKFIELVNCSNALFIDGIVPLAGSMAMSAHKRLQEQKFENSAYFEPFYLKEFIATTSKVTKPGIL